MLTEREVGVGMKMINLSRMSWYMFASTEFNLVYISYRSRLGIRDSGEMSIALVAKIILYRNIMEEDVLQISIKMYDLQWLSKII